MKHATVNADFFIMRQNKRFCLYAGLLDAAHRSGLRSIRTHLVQAPSEANGQTAIAAATATFRDEGGELYTFDGIGDANAQNVGRAIAVHSIRMSETRAKARALRDALNIEVAAVEEMDMSEYSPDKAVAQETNRAIAAEEQAIARARQSRPPTPKGERPPAQIVPATEEQRRQVLALRKLLNQPAMSVQALTAEQATDQIAHWTAAAQKQPAREEHYTELVALANQLHNAGVDPQFPDCTFTVAEYVAHLRRMRALVAEHIPAAAAK